MNNPPAILVAEDDPADAYLFKRALSKAHINVPAIFVRDGCEAIDYLRGEPPFEDRKANPWPALIILDLVMPRMSGFEVLEWMRSNPRCNRIPVLAFSGVQNPTEIGRAYSLGAKFFLIKTADATQWVKVLHRVIEIYDLLDRGVRVAAGSDSHRPGRCPQDSEPAWDSEPSQFA